MPMTDIIRLAVALHVLALAFVSQAREEVAGNEFPGTRRFAGAEKISSIEENLSGGKIKRVSVVRDNSFHYPLIRIEEVLIPSKGENPEKLVSRTEMVADHLIVKARKGVTMEALEGLCSMKSLKISCRIMGTDFYLVQFQASDARSLDESVQEILRNQDLVEYAEPDYIRHAALTPDDPKFVDGTQWGMDKIEASKAWDMTTGDKSVTVAVIDSGVDYNHEDLKDNMWINPGETGLDGSSNDKATNGIDDDGNGYIDDVHGINAIAGNGDPMDDFQHGTHCAGTIGGAGNNGTGIAGVCWKVGIMALKFLDSQGSGTDSDAIKCIAYATKMGASLTSNSWLGSGYNQALMDEISDNGKLFVTSSGNTGGNLDYYPKYPACYDSPNIIVAGGSDQDDIIYTLSDYGKLSVDIIAPGKGIYGTIPGNQYQSLDGSSAAAPFVAGTAALMLAYDGDLTVSELKNGLMDNVDSVSYLAGRCVSGGRLNAYKAVKAVRYMRLTAPNGLDAWEKGTAHDITWISNLCPLNVTIELVKGGFPCSVIASDAANNGTFSWTIPSDLASGTDYRIRIKEVDGSISDESDGDFSISDKVVSLSLESCPLEAGTTSPTGTVAVALNVPYSISAVPADGYFFMSWACTNGAFLADETKADTAVTLIDNSVLTAYFGKYYYFVNEGFESGVRPPAGWTIIDGPNSLPLQPQVPFHWTIYKDAASAHTGNYSALSGLGTNLDEWLISPSVNLSGALIPAVSFWWSSNYASMVSPNDHGDLFIKVSADGGTTWSKALWTFGNIGPWESNKWYNTTIALPDYVGSTDVKIAFQVVSSNGAFVFVDDVLIKDKAAPAPTLKVSYPNGGESMAQNSGFAIQWTSSSSFTGNVKIELLKAGIPVETIAGITGNDWYYDWAIPSGITPGSDYRIRISGIDDASISDESAADFSIVERRYTLTVVNGTGGGDYAFGKTVGISADPAPQGKVFDAWTGAIVADVNASSTTIEMPAADTAVAANYKDEAEPAYTLSVVNGSGSGKYAEGTAVTIIADLPADGKVFDAWTGATVADMHSATATITMPAADTKVSATYKDVPLHALTVTSGIGGGLFAEGEEVPIAADTPPDGKLFDKWTGDTSAVSSPDKPVTTVVIPAADVSVTAAYKPLTVNLAMAVSPTGSGTTDPATGTISVSTKVPRSIAATAAAGYLFGCWNIDGDGTIKDRLSPETTVSLSGDAKVTAIFGKAATLTFMCDPPEGGTTDPSTSQNVTTGVGYDISATANQGYIFTNWSSSGAAFEDMNAASTKVAVSGDADIIAHFAVEFKLTLASNGNGTTDPAPGEHVCKSGDTVSINAIADPDYVFASWTASPAANAVLGSTVLPETTVVVVGDATVTATFAHATAELTVASEPKSGGSTSPSGTFSVNTKESQAISAFPAADWHFTGWTVSGGAEIADPASADTAVTLTADAVITAGFEHDTANLTMASAPADGGMTEPAAGSTTIDTNTPLEIKAVPYPHYQFVNWTAVPAAIFGKADSADTTVSISGDCTVTANFAAVKALLTMLPAIPAGKGTTAPPEGSIKVDAGKALDIAAIPGEGYRFLKWIVSGDAQVGDENSAETTIALEADASVQALFTLDIADISFGKVQIKLNDSKPAGDSISVAKAALPDGFNPEINPADFAFTVFVEDMKFDLTPQSGSLKKSAGKNIYSYKPSKGQFNVKLQISFESSKRFWSLSASRVELHQNFESYDGVGIYLLCGDDMFGGSVPMDETTKWKFARNDNGSNSAPLDVTGTPIEAFAIIKAEGKTSNCDKGAKDAFTVGSATGGNISFDSTSENATVKIDGWEGLLPSGRGWIQDPRKAVFSGNIGDGKAVLVIDFEKKIWKFKLSDADLSAGVDGNDGIDFRLQAGPCEGAVNLGTAQIRSFKYPRKTRK